MSKTPLGCRERCFDAQRAAAAAATTIAAGTNCRLDSVVASLSGPHIQRCNIEGERIHSHTHTTSASARLLTSCYFLRFVYPPS